MAVKSHAEHGDECERDENPRSRLMVSFCSVDPFFGSTRAASILPSRPPNRTAAARRACQGWPRLRGHPKGLALTGPSTAACLIGLGLEAAGFCARTGQSFWPAGLAPTPTNQNVRRKSIEYVAQEC